MIPEWLENDQKIIEKIQKYKDWNLTVYFLLMKALLTKKKNSIWERKVQNQIFMDSIKFYWSFNWIYGGFDCKKT
jgi:hypothetical protein